jgi:hypothetical protein
MAAIRASMNHILPRFEDVDLFYAHDSLIILPNVPSDLSLLAFGIPPAREAESAGGMPKVPKGQGLDDMKGSKVAQSAPPWNMI